MLCVSFIFCYLQNSEWGRSELQGQDIINGSGYFGIRLEFILAAVLCNADCVSALFSSALLCAQRVSNLLCRSPLQN